MRAYMPLMGRSEAQGARRKGEAVSFLLPNAECACTWLQRGSGEVIFAEVESMSRERKHPLVEDHRQFRVQQMPAPGQRAYLQWADGATATLERQGEAVDVFYRWPDGDGWRTTVETVRLMTHRPYLGGVHHFIACSQCGRRAHRFKCRRCGNLANRSQSQGAWVRALQRARRIRQRLGADGGAGDPMPPRPKGMRQRTYRALVAEVRALEAIPPTAWLTDGHRVALGIRRDRMGGKQRCRWWPSCNHRAA
jgi:hypothetical protein